MPLVQAHSNMPSDLKAKLIEAKQEHLLTFWDKLDEKQRKELTEQLEDLDLLRINRIFKKATEAPPSPLVAELAPLPDPTFGSTIDKNPGFDIAEAREAGLAAMARGEVAVLLLAGGQGTRLGSSAPKGCYDIKLPSHKSLFQLQGERLHKMEMIARKHPEAKGNQPVIPWYVMTSGPTRAETEKFFHEKKFFGLEAENVKFFNQGVLPAFDFEGKIFLESSHALSVAPDGNGGVYAALHKEGIIEDMVARGIKYVHAYCVDNCLVKIADPVFVGYGIIKNADCGCKVVRKATPTEPVGVVCLRNGKFNVVEYSEFDPILAQKTDEDGQLLFGAANIANHFYTVDFLERCEKIEQDLEYHVAKKKIKHVDLKTGEVVKPEKNNGIKLEMFIFDVFPYTERFAVLEVDRAEEFSPLKNAPGTGTDDPETSRRDILAQMRRFLDHAKIKVEDGVEVEISPLLTYAGEGLDEFAGKTIHGPGPVVLNSIADLKNHTK